MAVNLSTTRQEAQANGVKILVYGQAGMGKTTLITSVPDHSKAIILSAESGLLSIADTDIAVLKITQLEDLKDAYVWLTTTEQGKSYDWICVDSLSEIAEVVLKFEKERAGKDKRAAYVPMQEVVESMIKSFRDLSRNIYMTCKLDTYQDDNGRIMLRPMLVGQKLPVNVTYLFDEVFFMTEGRDAEGGSYRYLQTQPDHKTQAKDRSGKLDAAEYPSLANIAAKILNQPNQTNEAE